MLSEINIERIIKHLKTVWLPAITLKEKAKFNAVAGLEWINNNHPATVDQKDWEDAIKDILIILREV